MSRQTKQEGDQTCDHKGKPHAQERAALRSHLSRKEPPLANALSLLFYERWGGTRGQKAETCALLHSKRETGALKSTCQLRARQDPSTGLLRKL